MYIMLPYICTVLDDVANYTFRQLSLYICTALFQLSLLNLKCSICQRTNRGEKVLHMDSESRMSFKRA